VGFTIAMAGKGGSGKTTIAALIIRYLLQHKLTPILAVDADPNANLHEVLGLDVESDLAAVLAEFSGSAEQLPPGIDKASYLQMRVQDVLVEGEDLDFLAMGSPEGAGCYCFPNAMLRQVCGRLVQNFRFVVIDNEAGLEHLSRRTTDNVDLLVVVSDSSIRGVRAAARINRLTQRLNLKVRRRSLLVTKVQGRLPPEMRREIKATALEFDGVVPYDPMVAEYDTMGRPLIELPDTSLAVKWFDPVIAEWLNIAGQERQEKEERDRYVL